MSPFFPAQRHVKSQKLVIALRKTIVALRTKTGSLVKFVEVILMIISINVLYFVELPEKNTDRILPSARHPAAVSPANGR